MMFRVIVAGSRGFSDYPFLRAKLDEFLATKLPHVTIISGTARGADELGERYAQEHNLPLERYPAEWDKYGKSAGYRRNETMANKADALVALWDGMSRGTRHMIDTAKRRGLAVRIVRYQ